MTEQTPQQDAGTTRRRRRRTITIAAAVVVAIAGAATIVSVGAARADAEETARRCRDALEKGHAASAAATASLGKADAGLAHVKSLTLPGGEGWTSGSYAARPASASTRPSGAAIIDAVVSARRGLADVVTPTACGTRDQAALITARSRRSAAAATKLDSATAALLGDFAAFQAEEHVRIAAEREAARRAAEEAARQAAEAAAEEAARQAAAEQAAREARSSGGGGGSGDGGSTSDRSSGGGGGSVGGGPLGGGVGSGGGGCRTSNGMGGTTSC